MHLDLPPARREGAGEAFRKHLFDAGYFIAFLFLICGSARLARFNVSAGRTDPRYFVGMPITAGAACVAAVVVAWPQPLVTNLARPFPSRYQPHLKQKRAMLPFRINGGPPCPTTQ